MDISVLNLDENEYIVYEKDDSYVLFKDEELELYITNLNLILINETSRIFKKPTYEVKKWAIKDIQVINQVPQITLEYNKDYGYWMIVILMSKGIFKFGMYVGSSFRKNEVKKEAELLIEKITTLRKTGTIVLKKNVESNGSFVESQINKLKKSSVSEKLQDGLNFIKGKVKPDKANEVHNINRDDVSQETTMNQSFNYCHHCGTMKNKDVKFCPSCGTPQTSSKNVPIQDETNKSFITEGKTVQEIYDTFNEEQQAMVELIVDLVRNNIDNLDMASGYLGIDNEISEGKTVNEVFDTLNEEQKKCVYAIIGIEQEETEKRKANTYIIRFHTVINRTNIVINGIFIKQLDKNQYYDFEAELNVRYDIELSTVIFVALESKKTLTVLEKTPNKYKWIGFGTAGNLAIEDYDMELEEDKKVWFKDRPKDIKVN